jgi:anti-sigma factor RsiW
VTCQDARHLLHGYLDGELDLVRSLEIEEHLGSCAACRDLQKSQQVLRNAFRSGELYYRAPAALQARIESAVRGAARRRARSRVSPWVWTGVAAAVALAAGLTLSPLLSRSRGPDSGQLAQQVLASYLSFVLAGRPPDVASSNSHTVKPWFQGKLDFSPSVPDLAAQGFPLVGGNLDYVDGHPVATLVYHRRKHIISLLIWPVEGAADSPPAEQARQGYHLISWVHSGMAFWAVSDVNPTDLHEFVSLVGGGP